MSVCMQMGFMCLCVYEPKSVVTFDIVYVYVCVNACVCVCLYACTNTCLYVYMCMFVCVCVDVWSVCTPIEGVALWGNSVPIDAHANPSPGCLHITVLTIMHTLMDGAHPVCSSCVSS